MFNKLILPGVMSLISLTASSQGAMKKGRIEVYDLDSFRLHVYYTNDPLSDASYVIEGEDGLVTMEQPLFRDNAAEFDSYVAGLKKPVERIITDYHVGSTGAHEVAMPEGMPEFTTGPVYREMMQSFADVFGDAVTALPTGGAEEIKFGTTVTWAGVSFTLLHGAPTDFPGASIVIGGKVYYTHWAPCKAHMSHLQLSSPAALDAEIAEARRELDSGCILFIGGHGGAAEAGAVEFKIQYLKTVSQLLSGNPDAGNFAEALKEAFPGLPGAEGVNELAAALYSEQ